MSNILLAKTFAGQEVRVAGTPDEPWFVANDVCAVLGLSNVSQAVSRLEAWMKDDITTNDVTGREQSMLGVNEPGLYALVFTSRKPEAKAFQHWVYSEVLPSIRKTGQYRAGNAIARPANLLTSRRDPWEQLEPEEMIKRFEWVVKRVGVKGCFDYGYGKAILNDIIDAHHLTLPIPYADEIYRREVKPTNHEYQVLKLLLRFLGLRFEQGRLVGFDGRSAAFPSEKMPRYLAVKSGVVEDFCDGFHSFASCLRLTAVHNNALVDVISDVPEKCWFFSYADLEKAFKIAFDSSHIPTDLNSVRYGLERVDGRLCLPDGDSSVDVSTLFRSCLFQLGVSLDRFGDIVIDPMQVCAELRPPVIHRTRDGRVYLAVESPSLARVCGDDVGSIMALVSNHRGTARFPDGKGSTSPARCRWFDLDTVRTALS